MHECSVHGKRPALTSFVGRAEENFELRNDSTKTQNVRELAWFLLRLIRKNALKADDTYGEQSSGLEDGFIRSSLYGSSSTMALLQGKSYRKGI
ncbi:unnamed protein product [Porites lobata]|uniref:Uncharacterized protein n=1 Tax=Porites lobata TaxID=104759 RepID=A0ABN8NZ59_9CNID|nr:unnamed protein product [Porites lobata]